MKRSVGSALVVAAFALAFTQAPSEAYAADEPAPVTAPAAPAPAPAPAETTSKTVTTDEAAKGHHTAGPWILLGGGVALVVSAAVLGALTVSEDDKREKAETKLTVLQPGDPQRAPLEKEIQDHDDKAGTTRTASIVCGTVGFLAIAGSIVWWFAEGSSSVPASATGRAFDRGVKKPALTPSLGPGYAGANLALRF